VGGRGGVSFNIYCCKQSYYYYYYYIVAGDVYTREIVEKMFLYVRKND